MTSIAKSTRVALAIAVVSLATAGAASAGAFHPDPFVSTGAPADVYSPADVQPLGSSWSSIIPAGWKWAPESHIARFHLNRGGCNECTL